jgi:hypothetical protein
MSDLRELLERVAERAPAANASFRGELLRRIDLAERSRRRSRALVLGAAVALVAAALAAGGVMAFDGSSTGTSVIDRTLACPVPDRGGVNVLDLYARVGGRVPGSHKGETSPSAAGVVLPGGTGLPLAGVQTRYVAFDGKTHELAWTVDTVNCKKAPTIPLSSGPLPRIGTLTRPLAEVTRECWLAPSIVTRLRVRLVDGHSTSAQFAVRSGAKRRLVIYVDWTPTRSTVYAAASCHTSP